MTRMETKACVTSLGGDMLQAMMVLLPQRLGLSRLQNRIESMKNLSALHQVKKYVACVHHEALI